MFVSQSGVGGRGSHGRSRQAGAGSPPPTILAILVPLLVSLALVGFGCGGETTTTTTTTEVVETTTTTIATTTTTLTGFAAIAPQGFPSFELPTDALLISSDPPVGQIDATVTAFYAHEADVMEESKVWKQKLKDAGFTLSKDQAWKGGGIDGYILRGSTEDAAYDVVIVGGDALAIERNPFYEVPADTIPGELEKGFVLVLTSN